ncbi:MAG: hypothetical protein U0270_38050 [Labilithrix sp.]
MKGHLVAALALLLAACGHQDAAPAAPAPVKLSLVVYSGRENPPPQTTAVRVGAAVSVHLEGLGPPRARVLAPDGSEMPTRTEGSEQRFTVNAAGRWRIELEGDPGSVLAYLDAT